MKISFVVNSTESGKISKTLESIKMYDSITILNSDNDKYASALFKTCSDVKYKKAVDTTADILFICDDRTEISETMVDKVVNLFKDSSVDVVYTDYIKNIDGKELKINLPSVVATTENISEVKSFAIRAKLFEDSNIDKLRYRYLIYHIPEYLYNYYT